MTTIYDMELTTRTNYLLVKSGITTVEQIKELTLFELAILLIKDIRPNSIRRVWNEVQDAILLYDNNQWIPEPMYPYDQQELN